MSALADRLELVRQRIRSAEAAAGRAAGSVRLIAVSKRMPAEAIREAYAAGQRDFGENYVQELRQKSGDLTDLPDLRLHLIGHLQTNKVKSVVGAVSMIQSVDSLRLVDELSRRVTLPSTTAEKAFPWVLGGAQTGGPLPLLVEVSIAGEAQKSGCDPEDLPAILDTIEAAPNLALAGLMTVPPFSDRALDARPHFEKLFDLRERLGGPRRLPELSMGMTLDLEIAIAAGATLVRVGTAIFGERSPKGQSGPAAGGDTSREASIEPSSESPQDGGSAVARKKTVPS